MPCYRCLAPVDQRELEGHVQVLICEKYFEGCAGLIVTDEMKVLIAAQASLLLLHREDHYFPWMRTILIYPNTFVGNGRSIGPAGVITEGTSWRQGESWYSQGSGGPVILSWSDSLAGVADPRDGHNLVLHEFAHQLDADNGAVDGVPMLSDEMELRRWKSIMAREQQQLAHDTYRGLATVLNPYGLQNPAEFFAVAVEAFFERPAEMRAAHSDLYSLLQNYFKQDPASLGACSAIDAA
jgi:MtfA peptidase